MRIPSLRRPRPEPARPEPAPGCAELAACAALPEPAADADGCRDCLDLGETTWAHLRMCLDCGHVACCDSSPHRHATAHHEATGHPVVRSVEPGETWRWCYRHAQLG